MKTEEFAQIVGAILILFIVISFAFILKGNYFGVAQAFVFAIVIIAVHVVVKKVIAYSLDANVEHRLWKVYRYGLKENYHFKKEVPFGVILPLILSIFSLGIFKFMSILTYETSALKRRAAKRFGYYSYTEMTDWHNGLIGAAGIAGVLLLSVVGYFIGFEFLAKMAAYYAFFNMLPISDLDGTQIFFGNRILWTVLAVIVLIFAAYGLIIPV